jgi:hypothetical protein
VIGMANRQSYSDVAGKTGPDELSSTRRPNLGYIGIVDMTRTAEQILEQIRELTPAERLHVVERVIHEMADEVTPQPAATTSSIWSDESDADFKAFQSSVQQQRTTDTLASDEPRPTSGRFRAVAGVLSEDDACAMIQAANECEQIDSRGW